MPWSCFLLCFFLLVTIGRVFAQITGGEGYIKLARTKIEIIPPPGFAHDEPQRMFSAGDSYVQLESLPGKPFKLPDSPRTARPISWVDSTLWRLDTLIDGRWMSYTSYSQSYPLVPPSGPGQTKMQPPRWQGILRFGDGDDLHYLVASANPATPELCRALEQSLFSVRIGRSLSTARAGQLFELNLTEFAFKALGNHENAYGFMAESPIRNTVDTLMEAWRNDPKSLDSLDEMDRKWLWLAVAIDGIISDGITVTQYGEGTGAYIPTKFGALEPDHNVLSDHFGLRGTCEIYREGKTKIGGYSADYMKYRCSGGKKAFTGAIYFVVIGQNAFRITYDIGDWKPEDVARLERALAGMRFRL